MTILDVQSRTQIEYQKQEGIDHTSELQQDLKLIVVIPAYNEARFIGSTVLKALEMTDHVLVVDDGSDDDTAQIAEAAGATVLRHKSNIGKGAALNSGFGYCRQMEAQCVVTLDADGQHLPEEMGHILGPVLEGCADLVIGSRYIEAGNRVPWHRVWGHRVFNLLTKLASGVHVSDSQSGYRALSARALDVICFTSRGFSVESEMQFIAREKGLKVEEVPITISYQDQPKRSVLLQGILVLFGVLDLVRRHRPLLYFGLPGGFFLVIGIGWGLRALEIYQHSHQVVIGHALVSLLVSVVGMVMLSTGIILHSIRSLLMDTLISFKKTNREVG